MRCRLTDGHACHVCCNFIPNVWYLNVNIGVSYLLPQQTGVRAVSLVYTIII